MMSDISGGSYSVIILDRNKGIKDLDLLDDRTYGVH